MLCRFPVNKELACPITNEKVHIQLICCFIDTRMPCVNAEHVTIPAPKRNKMLFHIYVAQNLSEKSQNEYGHCDFYLCVLNFIDSLFILQIQSKRKYLKEKNVHKNLMNRNQ